MYAADLFEVERDGDPVELASVGDGRALPPAIAAVDGELGRVSVGGAIVVADAALDAVARATLDVLDELAERLGARALLLAARRVRRDVGVRRQVEHVRKPTFRRHIHALHVKAPFTRIQPVVKPVVKPV